MITPANFTLSILELRSGRESITHSLEVRWYSKIKDIKDLLHRITSVPPSKQQIFQLSCATALSSSLTLHDLRIEGPGHTLILSALSGRNSTSVSNFVLNPSSDAQLDEECRQLLNDVRVGLQRNQRPAKTDILDCTGGVYFMRSASSHKVAVFKPHDEEQGMPNNPKGHGGNGEHGLRPFFKPGNGCLREVAAYIMDAENFSRVPSTALVYCEHPVLHYPGKGHPFPKLGSLQTFVDARDSFEDLGSSVLSDLEVQRIALLDIRLLNCDRNASNILAVHKDCSAEIGDDSPHDADRDFELYFDDRKSAQSSGSASGSNSSSRGDMYELIPIDHGYCLPSRLSINEIDWAWFYYPQINRQVHDEIKAYLKRIDFDALVNKTLEQVYLSSDSIFLARLSHQVLVDGVSAGLTLYDIASLIARIDEELPSPLERVISEAEENAHRTIEMRASTKSRANSVSDDLSPTVRSHKRRLTGEGGSRTKTTAAFFPPDDKSSSPICLPTQLGLGKTTGIRANEIEPSSPVPSIVPGIPPIPGWQSSTSMRSNASMTSRSTYSAAGEGSSGDDNSAHGASDEFKLQTPPSPSPTHDIGLPLSDSMASFDCDAALESKVNDSTSASSTSGGSPRFGAHMAGMPLKSIQSIDTAPSYFKTTASASAPIWSHHQQHQQAPGKQQQPALFFEKSSHETLVDLQRSTMILTPTLEPTSSILSSDMILMGGGNGNLKLDFSSSPSNCSSDPVSSSSNKSSSTRAAILSPSARTQMMWYSSNPQLCTSTSNLSKVSSESCLAALAGKSPRAATQSPSNNVTGMSNADSKSSSLESFDVLESAISPRSARASTSALSTVKEEDPFSAIRRHHTEKWSEVRSPPLTASDTTESSSPSLSLLPLPVTPVAHKRAECPNTTGSMVPVSLRHVESDENVAGASAVNSDASDADFTETDRGTNYQSNEDDEDIGGTTNMDDFLGSPSRFSSSSTSAVCPPPISLMRVTSFSAFSSEPIYESKATERTTSKLRKHKRRQVAATAEFDRLRLSFAQKALSSLISKTVKAKAGGRSK